MSRFMVLVCGGRNYGIETDKGGFLTETAVKEKALMNRILSELHEKHCFTHVLEGGARGADALAGSWARFRGIQTVVCDAGWNLYGNAAGHLRNKRMAELEPQLVVAFPGGRGTAGMVQIAKANDIQVIEVTETDELPPGEFRNG